MVWPYVTLYTRSHGTSSVSRSAGYICPSLGAIRSSRPTCNLNSLLSTRHRTFLTLKIQDDESISSDTLADLNRSMHPSVTVLRDANEDPATSLASPPSFFAASTHSKAFKGLHLGHTLTVLETGFLRSAPSDLVFDSRKPFVAPVVFTSTATPAAPVPPVAPRSSLHALSAVPTPWPGEHGPNIGPDYTEDEALLAEELFEYFEDPTRRSLPGRLIQPSTDAPVLHALADGSRSGVYVCRAFRDSGRCDRTDCSFSHVR